MHRLILSALLLSSVLACGASKEPLVPSEDQGDEGHPTDGNGEADGGAADASAKADECTGFDIANLDELLNKSACEVQGSNADAIPNVDLKGKLAVAVTASPTRASRGGKVDLLVTFTNQSKEPLPLFFRLDPLARFETEALNPKTKKRADIPAGEPPPFPSSYSPPPSSDPKAAKVVLAPSGSARVRLVWDAVKTKWAPSKLKGSSAERGYPRVPAGPLPKGKYDVKVVTPLIGVLDSEGVVATPQVELEVGN